MGHSVSKTLGNDQIAKNGKVRYGFKVGDRVTFEEHLSGVVVSDIITGITVKDSREERMRISRVLVSGRTCLTRTLISLTSYLRGWIRLGIWA